MEALRKSMESLHTPTQQCNQNKRRMGFIRRMREADTRLQIDEICETDIQIPKCTEEANNDQLDRYDIHVPENKQHVVIRDLKDCVGIDLDNLYIDSYFDHDARTRGVDTWLRHGIAEPKLNDPIIRRTVEQCHSPKSSTSYGSVDISYKSALTSEFEDVSSFNTVNSMVDTESQKSEMESADSSVSIDSDIYILYGLDYSDIPDVDL